MEIRPTDPPTRMIAGPPLEVRLLGDLRLQRRNEPPMTLPASKKTRALIGYLVGTGQPHRRERLCDLLWEGPDDPRAALRWSLNKIRPLLNDVGLTRLRADREQVSFEAQQADVDLARLRQLLPGGVSSASLDHLKEAVGLFRGEFLDGLDLPACYRYQEWCLAEREVLSRLRLAALSALVERLNDTPEDALSYARAMVAIDPLSETGHAAVVRLLGRLGREKDALGHYHHAHSILEKELGAAWSDELERARLSLRSVPSRRAIGKPEVVPSARSEERPPKSRTVDQALPLVGRSAERDILDGLVSAAAAQENVHVLLVMGEPGIGKSHMLNQARDRMRASAGRAAGGRAFEAETARPYGIWIDPLSALARERDARELRDLAPLLPGIGRARDATDKSRLFDGVVSLLKAVAVNQPIIITLDDLQWIDEASASLLHYIVRKLDEPSRILLACAARSGELADNAAAAAVLQALGRNGRLRELRLGPLSPDETAQLIHAIDPRLDSGHVFAESEGNPLFSLELARARAQGDDNRGPTIQSVIVGQLGRLKDRSRDLLMWAAALGRSFTVDVLGRVAAFETPELLGALDELERRGMIQPIGDSTYDFVHDLVRQTTYANISQPRRKLLHRQIAQFLADRVANDDTVASDLARHAALSEDHTLAARACVAAGDRALRLFANTEAIGLAESGLRHLERLPHGPARLEIYIGLLKVRILAAAGPGMRPLPPLGDELAVAVAEAEALKLAAVAATGHWLLSLLHQEAGDHHGAQENMLRAAQVVCGTDPATQAHQLANTARCLLELETEVARSRALIREAEDLAKPLRLELCEMYLGRGLLSRWDGEQAESAQAIETALALARKASDRWREYKCLTWLAMVELERGGYAAVRSYCADLLHVAGRLGEGEVPFVVTLEALARLGSGGDPAQESLADALQQLRAIDDKSYLAYALNIAAKLHFDAGRLDAARECAAKALAVAEAMQRKNEIVIAQALLTRCAGVNEPAGNARKTGALMADLSDQDGLSGRARSALLEAANAASDSNDGSNAARS